MVKIDLSEILSNTNSSLETPFDEICKLLDTLATSNTSYIGNVNNVTIGKKPSEGLPISQLPDTDKTRSFIVGKLIDLTNNGFYSIEQIYLDSVFQVLIATGVIPLGWLYNNDPSCISMVYNKIRNTWDRILAKHSIWNEWYGPLYTHITSFGLLTKRVQGHSEESLCFYCIYNNETDRNFLQRYVSETKIDNLIIMSENEYSDTLVNDVYTYLVKFNKTVNPYTGVSFKTVTNLKEVIPEYLLEVGCDSTILINSDDVRNSSVYYNARNPKYCVKKFKRGEAVAINLRIPANHAVSFVSLNGTIFFNGTADLDAAGISIVELDATTHTGYKTIEITVSGLFTNSSLYISSCEDLTGKGVTKNILSSKSAISVGDNGVMIDLIFNSPFIYLDTNKIKVWAKKDDSSEPELVGATSFIVNEHNYLERIATFQVATTNTNSMLPFDTCNPHLSHEDFAGKPHMGNNPYIFDNFPHRKPSAIPVQDSNTGRVMLHGVVESGSIFILFDGYTDYKYFFVEFDDRAMISTIRIPGTSNTVDVIPVIEKKAFVIETNNSEEENEDDTTGDTTEPEGDTNGEIETPTTGEEDNPTE